MNMLENHEYRERKLRPDDLLGHLPTDQDERTILWLGTLYYHYTLAKIQAPAAEGRGIKATFKSMLQYSAAHPQFAGRLNSAILSTLCTQTKPGLPDSDAKLTR